MIVDGEPGCLKARVLGQPDQTRVLHGEAEPGSVIIARGGQNGPLHCTETLLATPNSVRAGQYEIAFRHGLSPTHPAEVMAEAAGWVAEPGLDDPRLEDLTHLPFVTLDDKETRDLDQAVWAGPRPGGGSIVIYAKADASYYVRPNTALYAEAKKRGVTHYFARFDVPMLPKILSEGIISLNPGVVRRSKATIHEIDEEGRVVS